MASLRERVVCLLREDWKDVPGIFYVDENAVHPSSTLAIQMVITRFPSIDPRDLYGIKEREGKTVLFQTLVAIWDSF